MTNVPVERGNTARQQPQVATTDADRDRDDLRAVGVVKLGSIEYVRVHAALQAIARARADADEAGYSRGLREGAASERGECAAWHDERAAEARRSINEHIEMEVGWLLGERAEMHECAATAIRARGERDWGTRFARVR